MLKKILIFIPLYCVWVMVALGFSFGTFGSGGGYLSPVSLILYLVLILAPVWVFNKWINYVPAWIKQVEAEGKEALATIVSVKEAGIVINRTIDVIRIRLRVEPPGEAPFEVNQEKRVSLFSGLGGLTEGTHVHVKYDPNNKQHVVILSGADAPSYSSPASSPRIWESGSPGAAMAHNLAELSHLHKSGELTDAEFEAAKKKLLSS